MVNTQAIGGVAAKIEGFFDVCREKGLTGQQGVIIPAANATTLMVREDVIEAVAAGQFHIYPVRTIDEGIALLTGRPAGQRVRGRVASRRTRSTARWTMPCVIWARA